MPLGFAPLCALGVHRSGHLRWVSPAWMMLVATLAYSGNVHKEYRLLLPMVPVALVYAAVPLGQWFDGQAQW